MTQGMRPSLDELQEAFDRERAEQYRRGIFGEGMQDVAATLDSVTTVVTPGVEEDEESVAWTHLPDQALLELDPRRPLAAPKRITEGEAQAERRDPATCPHPAGEVMVETLVALVEAGRIDDEHMVPERREIRVKAFCGACGTDFDVAREGRAPRDGSPGTVLTLTSLVCETPPVPD